MDDDLGSDKDAIAADLTEMWSSSAEETNSMIDLHPPTDVACRAWNWRVRSERVERRVTVSREGDGQDTSIPLCTMWMESLTLA